MPKDYAPAGPVNPLDLFPWKDLHARYLAKGEMLSVKTLSVVIEGLEELQAARQAPGCTWTVTPMHEAAFAQLKTTGNNPRLLKDIGVFYLERRLFNSAVKHLQMAHQLAPKDPDILKLKQAAELALKNATEGTRPASLGEVTTNSPRASTVIRNTARLNVKQAQKDARETATRIVPRAKPVTTSTGETVDDLLNMAEDHITQEKFGEAAALLEQARLKAAPPEELYALYNNLGLALFLKDKLDEALHSYEKARELNAQGMEGWFNCGLVLQRQGLFTEAMKSYREAVRLDPENAKVWCSLSTLQFEHGFLEEAEKSAREAIKFRKDYARAWNCLAAALTALEKLDEAEEATREAIRLQPGLPSAWFNLGVILFQNEKLKVSEEAFQLCGNEEPYYSCSRFYLCMVALRSGDINRGREFLIQGQEADPENELEYLALKEFGAAYVKKNDLETAAECYAEITRRCPEDIEAWLALGSVYYRHHMLTKAREVYLKLTTKYPTNPLPWHNLGELAAQQNNHGDACIYFHREVELSPEDPKAWHDLAESLEKSKRLEEARTAYARAEELIGTVARQSSDLSSALSIVKRLGLGGRGVKT